MSLSLLKERLADHTELVAWTIGQYHRMIETGILPEGEPIELLDGLIVYKDRGAGMTVHPLHALIVNRLMQLGPILEGLDCHVRLQNPITIAPNHEPEPDGVIVRGTLEDYAHSHPGPTDVLCVIEVADSSLERDRVTKQHIYATAEIPQYIIINLADRQVEVYEQPTPSEGQYRRRSVLTAEGIVSVYITHNQRIDIPAAQWLP